MGLNLPTTINSHGPIVMPLPTFAGHHAATQAGNLIETESAFFHDFLNFVSLTTFFPVCSETLPLLSRPGTPSKHKPTSYIKQVHIHNRATLLLSFRLFPNRPLPKETPTLASPLGLAGVERSLADCRSKDQSGSAMVEA